VPATGQAEKDLGLGMKFSLDEALARTLDWHR
jgi:hypothetical protein